MDSKLISAGLEPVLSHIEKNVYHRFNKQFFRNNKIKNNTSFVSLVLWPLGAKKPSCYLIFYHFNICEKLSILRCDK